MQFKALGVEVEGNVEGVVHDSLHVFDYDGMNSAVKAGTCQVNFNYSG
jgi:hypothetical protein